MDLIVWLWDAKCGTVSVARLAPTALIIYNGVAPVASLGSKGLPHIFCLSCSPCSSQLFVQHTLATC